MTVVVFTPSSTEDVEVTPVGGNLFRLDWNPGPGNDTDLEFGDVFEADSKPDGSLEVIRLAQKSGWRNYSWIFGIRVLEYKTFHCFRRQIEAEGGHWDVIMAGIVAFNLPPGSSLDPQAVWDSCFQRFGKAPARAEDKADVVHLHEHMKVDLKARFGPREE